MIRRIQHINTYIRSYSSNIKVFAFFKRGLLGNEAQRVTLL